MDEARAKPAATLASQGMEKGTLDDRISSEHGQEALIVSFFSEIFTPTADVQHAAPR